jgi:hypothetical protein
MVGNEDEIVEWQRFPWVILGDANQLRADIDGDGEVTFRINDEVAATFAWTGGMYINIGFYGEAGETDARFAVEQLRLWSANP